MKRPLLVSWVVSCLLILVLHGRALSFGFWADDVGFAAFTPRSVADWLNYWNPSRGWFYRPVYLSWWGLFKTLGIASPFVMHGTGLGLHATICWLWGVLIWRLSRHVPLSLVASFSFALWPGKAEAINWVASHSTLLAALFCLLSLHAWLSWRRRNHFAWYVLSLVCFWLGCCSKNEAVATLALFPVLDALFAPRGWRSVALSMIPVLVLGAAFVGLELHAAKIYAASDHNYNAAGFPLWRRFTFVCWFIDRTLKRVVPFYPFSVLSLFVVPLLAAIVRVMRALKAPDTVKRTLYFGLVFWLLSSIPVPAASGFIALGERFTYIPALGLSLLVPVLLFAVVSVLYSQGGGVESGLSVSALALALLLAQMLLPWTMPSLSFEASVIAVLVLGAGCWLVYRSHWVDLRLSFSLFAVVLMQVALPFLLSDPSTIQFLFCLTLGTLWKFECIAGVLLALAMWQNPAIALGAIIMRALTTRFVMPHVGANPAAIIRKTTLT